MNSADKSRCRQYSNKNAVLDMCGLSGVFRSYLFSLLPLLHRLIPKMTLQWTAVALFLYVEIGVLVILCLPFISARRQVAAVTGGVSNAAKMDQDVALL